MANPNATVARAKSRAWTITSAEAGFANRVMAEEWAQSKCPTQNHFYRVRPYKLGPRNRAWVRYSATVYIK